MRLLGVLGFVIGMAADHGVAQDSVTTVAGAHYRAGSLRIWVLGQGYRDLWTASLRVPTLDLGVAGGGLTPMERGGGKQTRSLHLRGADGREYLFRSVDKFVGDALPPELQNTPAEKLGQELTASLHPAGALAVPSLLDAASVLHVVPRLYVMPDDPRLGEFRPAFAGMLGQFEFKPEEGPDDSPGFAGSRKIVTMETVQERLLEDAKHRVESRDYLAARLIDFLIGDTDRGSDQWRWARFDDGSDGYRWRPIPRDRDWAFINADGVGHRVARTFFRKLVPFKDDLPPLSALGFSSIHLDRQFLTDLDRSAWDSTTTRVAAAVSDSVIEASANALPPEYQAIDGARLLSRLHARVRQLPLRAAQFYAWLSEDVDIHGTDGRDVAEIRRLQDGGVEVLLYDDARVSSPVTDADEDTSNGRPYYHRRFAPSETHEIRIYLHGGDDRVRITGRTARTIGVRVIGGPGDDVLVDSSDITVGGTHTWLYDDESANNQIIAGVATAVDRRPFEAPALPDDWLARKAVRQRHRDWGSTSGVGPAIDYRSNTGLLLGVSYGVQQFGFRHVPYEFEWSLRLLYAPARSGFGAEFESRRTLENSAWSWLVRSRVSGFDAVRFYGFGNDTRHTNRALVEQDHAVLAIGANRVLREGGYLAAGVDVKYTRSDASALALQASPGLDGIGSFTQAGTWSEARIGVGGRDHERFTVMISGALYPQIASVASTYGRLAATTTARIGRSPTLALRAGAVQAWGAYPFFAAATIGGRASLRGYDTERFSGDQAVFGNAELRIPITTVTLLVRGQLGAFALADAGRVLVDGRAPGGWHHSAGGGLWVTSLGQTASVTYARGEGNKLYLALGLPF